MNTPWYYYKEYGCYYQIKDDDLYVAPALIDGDIEIDSTGPVEFDYIDEAVAQFARQVMTELLTKHKDNEQSHQ